MKKERGFVEALCVAWALLCVALSVGMPVESQAKPETFPIAVIADLTGPYAPTVGPTAPGVLDAVEYVNDELGGIDGVKMVAHIRDNKGEAALGLQQYAEVVGMKPKPLFLGVWHTPTGEAIPQKLVQDGIICIEGSSLPSLYPVGNAYGSYNLYEEMVAGAAKVARDLWKENRNPRAAILTWDTTFGRSILSQEFLDYLKEIKVDLVATELFGIRDVDVTTQVARIRGQNPDWLFTSVAGGGYLVIMKAVKELGLKVNLVSNVGLEAMARVQPQLFEGAIMTSPMRPFDDTEHPGIKKMLEYIKKKNRTRNEEALFYALGWQYAIMTRHVVRQAVAKVGWDKLDAAALKAELNGLKDWVLLDGVSITTYTEKRRTTPWLIPTTASGGKIKYLLDPKGKFIEGPDLRPPQFR